MVKTACERLDAALEHVALVRRCLAPAASSASASAADATGSRERFLTTWLLVARSSVIESAELGVVGASRSVSRSL